MKQTDDLQRELELLLSLAASELDPLHRAVSRLSREDVNGLLVALVLREACRREVARFEDRIREEES